MRRSLLLIQFALSSFMICGSLIVYEQLNYVTTKDKGLSSDQVLIIENADNLENQEVLKNELLNQSGIKNVSFSNGVIGGLNWTTSLGYPESFLMNYVVVHPGLIETLDMNLIAGRDFDASIPTDHEGLQLIVNQKALDELELQYP